MSDFSHVAPDEFPEDEFLGDVSIPGPSSNGNNSYEPFIDEGVEEAPFENATTQIGDGVCVVCGAPTFRPPGLTPTGRKKRIPRHCDLHSPHARISYEAPSTRSLDSQLQRIQDELADDIRLLGTLTGPLFPVTGMYILDRADPFTIALIKVCKNNQTMLRILHRAAQVAPVYTLAETCAGVGYSVQVDQKKADPHNNISRRLGVERAYNEVYPNDAMSRNNGGNVTFNPPPRYANATG